MTHREGDWVICTVPAKIVRIDTWDDSPEATYTLEFAGTRQTIDTECIETELIPEIDYIQYRVQMLDKKGQVFSLPHPIGADVEVDGQKAKVRGYIANATSVDYVLLTESGRERQFSTEITLNLWDTKQELEKQLEAELQALEEQQEAIAVKQDKIREIQAELSALREK